MISDLILKFHEARQRWLVIKNETRRRANTAERVGDAGLAILDVLHAETTARQADVADLEQRIESAGTDTELKVTTATGVKIYLIKSAGKLPYGYGFAGIIGEI
jgi:hypothetical protein